MPDQPSAREHGLPSADARRGSAAAPGGPVSLREVLTLLDRSQWWPGPLLRQRQQQLIARLVAHAASNVPFYRERFARAGLDPRHIGEPGIWRRVPLLTRRDIQDAGPALHSRRLPLDPRLLRRIVTSGSTGQPVMVLSTPLTRMMWRALTLRDHLWHRRDLSGRLAVIRHTRPGRALPPDGEVREGWGPATDGVARTGPGCLLNISSTLAEQAAWLLQLQPAYLLTYPSNLQALAEHFRRAGRALPSLREVRTLGEVVTPAVRAACRAAWNAPLVDVYSAQEVGYIALQCPRRDHYHVQAENVLVEVLDEQGEPCAPGEVGRVVVTALHNQASPLIRYDIGDLAEVGPTCDCGRALPVLSRILGRERNMLILPDGSRRWPSLGQAGDLLALPPFRQFQLVQRTPTRIEVRIVVPRPLSAEEESAARDYLTRMLGHPFEFDFHYVDEIPRGAGGKYEDFRCEVGRT